MLDHADNIIDLNAILHPGSVYDHPRDVIADQLFRSARSARSSRPGLRTQPASPRVRHCGSCPARDKAVTIDEILEALASLDHHPKGPPGGKPVRTRSVERTGLAA